LTGLSLEQLLMIQAAIRGDTVSKSEFKVTASKEYGASYACLSVLKSLDLHKTIFSRPGEDWVRSALAMIIGRLVYAGSKLSLSHCTSYSSLWEVCGIESDINVNNHCYDAMDKLLERQDAIQSKLASKHLQEGVVVLYDITSCYLEGEYSNSDLVSFGYNRDQKRGHEQIVISLLCTKEGCPVAVEVLRGNTSDKTTVLDKLNEIRSKYGIERIVFVGDRGMITRANYEEIDHDRVSIISALSHGALKSLCEQGVLQLSLFDENDIAEVSHSGIRYCLCKNPLMATKEAATRLALIQKTKDELDAIVASSRKTKYSKAMRAGKIIAKYKVGKFFVFSGEGESFSYAIDQDKVKQEALLDGCYVVYSDLPAEDMTAEEIVDSYKSLMGVEKAFRNMKTVTLELRPIYHKTDERIRCHVFICMLAYYVMWHMKRLLIPVTTKDAGGYARKYSFSYILETLKSIRKENVNFSGVSTCIITTPSEEQKILLDAMGVKL